MSPASAYHGGMHLPELLAAVSGARDWLRRLPDYMDPKDLLVLSPWGVAEALLRFPERARAPRPAPSPQDRDEDLVGFFLEGCRGIGRTYFRYEVRGAAHIPAAGPALLVGNHNGGPLPFDTFLTMAAVWDQHGPGRAVHPLTHDIVFTHPVAQKYARRLGVLRADPESAAVGLRAGNLVLVYPGSDIDAARPFTQRHRIELGGRTGFLKVALREQVPIVPVVSTGTHEQFIVLTRGDLVARLLHGNRRLRVNTFPIVLALPWGLTSGFLPYWPLPAQTTVAFGPAIRFPEVGPAQADDPEVLRRCYDEVTRQMQALLDRLAEGRRFLRGQRRP